MSDSYGPKARCSYHQPIVTVAADGVPGRTQKAPPLLLQKKWHSGDCKALDLAGAAEVSELGLRRGGQLQENLRDA